MSLCQGTVHVREFSVQTWKAPLVSEEAESTGLIASRESFLRHAISVDQNINQSSYKTLAIQSAVKSLMESIASTSSSNLPAMQDCTAKMFAKLMSSYSTHTLPFKLIASSLQPSVRKLLMDLIGNTNPTNVSTVIV